jgi:hypothetical protein
MSVADIRSRLAAEQARLLQALTGQAPPLADFDADRVRACATALLRKRARAVARAWPGLARALGKAFAGRFAAFAAQTSLPHQGGRSRMGAPLRRHWPHGANCRTKCGWKRWR